MSRYASDIAVAASPEEIERTVSPFLASEGFERMLYNGEEVWKKGHGLITAPQFIKVAPFDGHLRIEAWIKFALLPGVYFGESDMTGFMGGPVKRALAQRVNALEQALTARSETPAQWYPDPSGRHEHRYWDGRSWSDQVSDGGETALEPLGR